MNVILFILFALYVCWTTLIITKMISIKLQGKIVIWHPIMRNIWSACTAAVILYFWFN